MEYVLDSFAWLEYFGANKKYIPFVEPEVELPLTVITSLTEVARSLLKKGFPKIDVMTSIEFMISKSVILYIEKENAINAAFFAEEKKLHFADALIYSIANEKRKVVTGDRHFKNLEYVEFIS